MANSKKPRKRLNPHKTQFQRPPLFRYDKSEGETLKARFHQHLTHFENGDAIAGDWITIEFRVRTGHELCVHFNEAEAAGYLYVAKVLLGTIKARRIESGAWSMTPQEVLDLRAALHLADEIQDKTTRHEQIPIFEKAYKETDHRLFDALA